MTTRTIPDAFPLTEAQRAIVEAPDGPTVVIAGAGTGKTRVIVERVRWLLATKGDTTSAGSPIPAEPAPRHGNPFDGPLAPEQLLVLTYNVKAAAELGQRLDAVVGPATRARMSVSNFHSFCQRILTENAADAGLPARPDVLDGIGQLLLLREITPTLDLRYHADWALGGLVGFINRAKDELVSPDDFDAFVATERDTYEAEYGSFETATERLEHTGHLQPVRWVRGEYAKVRSRERAEAAGFEVKPYRHDEHERTAEREARRNIIGTGALVGRNRLPADQLDRIDALAATYVQDGAALEVMRLAEIARVYRAYEDAIATRGLLDFGEQIALVARLFKTRPNVLRRWQRQFRYILVDEFQDANVAQIELIELLGRTPDRPDNVMVVGDDDQSIYRFRGASFAAFAEFDTRFSRPPAHAPDVAPAGPPRHLAIEQNFRSTSFVLDAANRLIGCNETRFAPDKVLRTDRSPGQPIQLLVCAGPEDEAVAIVDAIRALVGSGPASGRIPGATIPVATIPVASVPALSVPVGSSHPFGAHVAVVPTMRNEFVDSDEAVRTAAAGDSARASGSPATAFTTPTAFTPPDAAGDAGAAASTASVATVVPLAWNHPDSAVVGDAAAEAAPPAEAIAPGDAAARVDASPGDDTAPGAPAGRAWNDVAVLYRKHKHRDAIVDRLKAEDIPFTIVGGLSLFETAEIRDLEQALRAIADPTDDAALVRMMTGGPWRLDALEILRVSRDAKFDRSHLLTAVHRLVDSGEANLPPVDGDATERRAAVDPALRAKLRNLLAAIEELNPRTWRDGPHTILERFLELNGTVLDLLATGTLEAKRSVVAIASFLRFTADWQTANPGRTLAQFIEYLEAFKAAGGELPTSVELSEDVEGVRLMTLYQAKGLEFPVVVVPDLVEGEWPVKEQGSGWFPRELLREQVPGGNLHLDEERRLLYVAITRAQERLLLCTHGGAGAKAQSMFVAELLDGRGPELTVIDRTLDDVEAEKPSRRRRGRRRRWGRTGRRQPEPTGPTRLPVPPPPWPPPAGSSRCPRRVSGASRCACAHPRSSACWRPPPPTIPRRTPPGPGSSSSWWTSAGPRPCRPMRRGRPAWTRSPSGPSRSTAGPARTSWPWRPCPATSRTAACPCSRSGRAPHARRFAPAPLSSATVPEGQGQGQPPAPHPRHGRDQPDVPAARTGPGRRRPPVGGGGLHQADDRMRAGAARGGAHATRAAGGPGGRRPGRRWRRQARRPRRLRLRHPVGQRSGVGHIGVVGFGLDIVQRPVDDGQLRPPAIEQLGHEHALGPWRPRAPIACTGAGAPRPSAMAAARSSSRWRLPPGSRAGARAGTEPLPAPSRATRLRPGPAPPPRGTPGPSPGRGS